MLHSQVICISLFDFFFVVAVVVFVVVVVRSMAIADNVVFGLGKLARQIMAPESA